jgi:hypothetical protein
MRLVPSLIGGTTLYKSGKVLDSKNNVKNVMYREKDIP